MEDRTDSPMAVKVEKHSHYVILTYFHGDTNSMVDAHFARALSSTCNDRAPAAKAKKIRKTVKLGESQKNPILRETGKPIDPHCFCSCLLQRRTAPARGVWWTLTLSRRFLRRAAS